LQAGEADLVLGSRFLDAMARQQVPRRRRWLLRLAVWVNWLFTGLRLTDAHNGLRALGPKALACLELRENRMAHATELLVEMRRHGLRYLEVPVTIDYPAYARRKGQTAWSAVGILSDLIWQKISPR
ncbi:MAG: glycosyltransferase family 2 protein, partial [Bacteroidetes bacterium]